MNTDLSKEFSLLNKRIDKSTRMYNSNRHLIDSRISNSDIITCYSYGICAVQHFRKLVKDFDNNHLNKTH